MTNERNMLKSLQKKSLEDKWIFSRIINLINKFACIFIKLLKSLQPGLMNAAVITISFTFYHLLLFRDEMKNKRSGTFLNAHARRIVWCVVSQHRSPRLLYRVASIAVMSSRGRLSLCVCVCVCVSCPRPHPLILSRALCWQPSLTCSSLGLADCATRCLCRAILTGSKV